MSEMKVEGLTFLEALEVLKAGAPFPSAIVVFRPSVMDAFSRQEVHPC